MTSPTLKRLLLATILCLVMSPAIPAFAASASASTPVTQTVNNGEATSTPPPPPTPAPSQPQPQPSNGPVVGALGTDTRPLPNGVNQISNVQIRTGTHDAFIAWSTALPSLTTVSWGAAVSNDAHSLFETTPRTTHLAYLSDLIPATTYTLDLTVTTPATGPASDHGITFTTLAATSAQPPTANLPGPATPNPQHTTHSPFIKSPQSPASPPAPTSQNTTAPPTTQQPSTGLCPNLTGLQTFVPLGMHLDSHGDCVPDARPQSSEPALTNNTATFPPQANSSITFSFVPIALEFPVHIPFITFLIRELTGSASHTFLTNDPDPLNPETLFDATGATASLAVVSLFIFGVARIVRFAFTL